MTIRKNLIGAVLALGALILAALPGSAVADTLHGTTRPGRTVVVGHRGHTGHGAHTGAHRGHTAHRAPVHRGHGHARHVARVCSPRAHVHRHGHCRYVDGHYATRRQRVVIPGHYVERVAPARYEIRWRSGRYVHVQVDARRVVREWVPERVEVRRKRIWVRGRWLCS